MRDGFGQAGTLHDGWIYPRPNIGRFGNDYKYRAQLALAGLAALPPQEATYLTAITDGRGTPLDGRNAYTLRIPADVPVRAFWSLATYQIEPDGRQFFTSNPIVRYTIGDRTDGLRRKADGSLTIVIQHSPPTTDMGSSNWLPSPAGPSRMTFRAYLTGSALLKGKFCLAPIERIS